MCIAFVQCIISTFHEYFGPLNERGGEKTGKGTDHDFLDKRGLHRCFNSSEGAKTARELRVSVAMSESTQTPPSSSDAEQLTRLLELELIHKRATWKQEKQRNKSFRSMAFLFLFLMIAGILLGFFFVYTRVSEAPPRRPTQTSGH